VEVIDNAFQFESNYTWEWLYRPKEERNYMLPILNVTKMISINFANIFPDCYQFVALEIGLYWEGIYLAVNKDFN